MALLDIPPEKRNPRDGFYDAWDKFLEVQPKRAKTLSREARMIESEKQLISKTTGDGLQVRESAVKSYIEASEECKAKVKAIVEECKRLNRKYVDYECSLGAGAYALQNLYGAYLRDMVMDDASVEPPPGVKRVADIFDEPQFFIDGAAPTDIHQGLVGDCWFLAALMAISAKKDLVDKLCVARDEKVGVYGFVFYRDGEWVYEVIDDKLFLQVGDDDDLAIVRNWDKDNKKARQVEYENEKLLNLLQRGGEALYFSHCKSSETWLPLIEKAYAKAHGDYTAVEGGYASEGIEDLTGGVGVVLKPEDILDKDRFWTEQLLLVNDKYLFGGGSPINNHKGVIGGHAYAVLQAWEDGNLRLIKLRNPVSKLLQVPRLDNSRRGGNHTAYLRYGQGICHRDLCFPSLLELTPKAPKEKRKDYLLTLMVWQWGKTEWSGDWSDGSKLWTPDMMKNLGHTFGDDGVFWISYKDFLKHFPTINRVRLFDDTHWKVAQSWTCVQVPWTVDYLDEQWQFTVSEKGPVVIVLSQPDDRYYSGLQGRFLFSLHFRVYKEGEKRWIVRSMFSSGADLQSTRSVSAEIEDLEPGMYSVVYKVTGTRFSETSGFYTQEEAISKYAIERREKLLSVGRKYDYAQIKGDRRAKEIEVKREGRLEERREQVRGLKKARTVEKEEKRRARLRKQRVKDDAKRRKAEIQAKQADEKAEKAKQSQGSTSVAVDTSAVAEAGKTSPAREIELGGTITDTKSEGSTGRKTENNTPPSEQDVAPTIAARAQNAVTTESATKQLSQLRIQELQEGVSVDAPVSPLEPGDNVGSEPSPEPLEDMSDNDFDWDSELDAPVYNSDDEQDPKTDLFTDDPWNALCVLGLRVYSMNSAASLSIVNGKSNS
ncbi:hypothetical protein LTR56_011006 [Elasticomyces elasticus]|nr:hypothetical protein LTR22_019592 [Elasticomyces elasticus]KAK3641905.1 hypothetical protein LTR56_011006 [Elasticomyces elasticus]KAK4905934.1 hypothetical protein LTR49_024853 [Elasticomyces elasticus]KAK5757500.1 hypothetical protein LTS12_012458 [Elasticomyces elasticus]